jgi:hypothetical protein
MKVPVTSGTGVLGRKVIQRLEGRADVRAVAQARRASRLSSTATSTREGLGRCLRALPRV